MTRRRRDELFALTGNAGLQNEVRCAKMDRKPPLGRTMDAPRPCNVLMLYPLFVADSFWSFAESCNLMGVRRPAAPRSRSSSDAKSVREFARPTRMNEVPQLASAMLAIAFAAVMLAGTTL